MNPFTSKLPDIGTTIFTVMTQLANSCNACNLSQGFPDFDVPEALIALVEKYMRAGYNQYAPMQGAPQLRRKIAEKVLALYGAQVDPETDITVTAGATEALFAAITAVVGRDDDVVVIEPAYDSYVPAIRLNAARPVYVTMKYPGYRIDWDEAEAAIGDRTRLLILNSPHNPTGTVLGTEDIDALKRLADRQKFFILSDEVYEHIVFDQRPHESILRHPELAERSFVVSSFGKTYHATGWKIGYCIAPAALTTELRRIHQFLTFAANTPIQLAYADFLEHKDVYTDLAAFYQKKRDRFTALLQGSRFSPLTCAGTYFQMVSYSDLSGEPDTVFAKRLTREFGVAAIPPSVFYHGKDDHRVLRFCFAKKDETLEQAAEILCKI